MKIAVRTSILIVIPLMIQSCAGFPKDFDTQQKLKQNNVAQLNGLYQVKATNDSSNINYHNAFNKFYRGKGRGSKDTIQIDDINRYSFGLNFGDNENVIITYYKNTTVLRTFKLEYELKDDRFAYLKNRNFKMLGVPYVFGSIDIKRIRLAAIDNDLLIDEVYHSSGSALLIFGDAKTWTNRHQYGKIKE